MKCPFFIMLPEHFRADGTCRCDCAIHRQKMMAEWGYTLGDFRRVGVIS